MDDNDAGGTAAGSAGGMNTGTNAEEVQPRHDSLEQAQAVIITAATATVVA